MTVYSTPPTAKSQTRTQTMDDFKRVFQILDISLNSELERALQTECIQSIRHILRMQDNFLNNLEYNKGKLNS